MFKVDMTVVLLFDTGEYGGAELGDYEVLERRKQISLPFIPSIGMGIMLNHESHYVKIVCVAWCVDREAFVCAAEQGALPIRDRDVWDELKSWMTKNGWGEVE